MRRHASVASLPLNGQIAAATIESGRGNGRERSPLVAMFMNRAHIGTALGKESSEEKVEAILAQLKAKRVLFIDAKGRVMYSDGR